MKIQSKMTGAGKSKGNRHSEGQYPFENAEEAWFWFIQVQEARNDWARFSVTGHNTLKRPCEPIDILKVIDQLYRNRVLLREHLLVLRHYGRRLMRPDPRRIKECRAYGLWNEALEQIEPVLVRKGIVREKNLFPQELWAQAALVLESRY